MYDEHRIYCEILGIQNLVELKASGLGHVNGWLKTDDMLVRVDKVMRLKKSLTVSYRNYIMPIPENRNTQEIDLSWLYKFRHVGSRFTVINKVYNDKAVVNLDHIRILGKQLNYVRKLLKSVEVHYEIEDNFLAIYDTQGIKCIIKGM